MAIILQVAFSTRGNSRGVPGRAQRLRRGEVVQVVGHGGGTNNHCAGRRAFTFVDRRVYIYWATRSAICDETIDCVAIVSSSPRKDFYKRLMTEPKPVESQLTVDFLCIDCDPHVRVDAAGLYTTEPQGH